VTTAATVLSDSSGVATTTLRETTAGTATVTATSGDAAGAPVTVTWLAAPTVTTLTLSPESATLELHSPTSQVVTATVLDQNGVPMSALPVTFTTVFGSGGTQIQTVNTDENGQAAITITSSTPDTATVTATAGELSSTSTLTWLAAPEAPEPTLEATPEPTPEPTLEATPEPTPEPVPGQG
jgi:adhesin/invasin